MSPHAAISVSAAGIHASMSFNLNNLTFSPLSIIIHNIIWENWVPAQNTLHKRCPFEKRLQNQFNLEKQAAVINC